MATLGSVVVEMSASTAKFESDLGRAAAMAERHMAQIDKAVDMVKSSIKTLGVTLGVGLALDQVKSKIERAIESAAGLQQLSERTGATVEALSGLASVAKLSGTDLDSMASGLQKLSKATVDAQNGGNQTSGAFKALGISLESLKGKGPEEALHGSSSSTTDITFNWTRRARVNAAWLNGTEVPLDESSESYLVKVLNGSTVVRTVTVTAAQSWVYSAANITADGFTSGQTITLTVAQNSDQGVLGHAATTSIQR